MKSKYTIWVIVAIVVAVLVFFYFKSKKKKSEPIPEASNKSSVNSVKKKPSPDAFPLRKGSSGENVRKLQELLNLKIKPPMVMLIADGVFGEKTEEALVRYFGIDYLTEDNYNRLMSGSVDYTNPLNWGKSNV